MKLQETIHKLNNCQSLDYNGVSNQRYLEDNPENLKILSILIQTMKEKDNNKVEYSFRDFNKPMGVSVYKTSETLPPELREALPDAETLKKLME